MKDKESTYLEDFQLAWSLTEKREPLIIFLAGTSGTGKSTISSLLASKFGISCVLSTDSIRHIMRNFLSKEENAVLFASTYEAGKHMQLDEKVSDQRRIIKGYKHQCSLVQQRLEAVIDKFYRNNDCIVIEGVHLTPPFMFKIMKKYKRVIPFALCIVKESKHQARFAVRSKYMTLDSRHNKYIANFQNIRLIQKWFLDKADEFLIPKVDNANLDKSLDLVHKSMIAYLKRMQREEIPFSELKNALPVYEEFNKINQNALSSKQLKDLVQAKVNKNEIYENFLKEMNNNKNKSMQEIEDNEIELQKEQTKQKLIQPVQKFNDIGKGDSDRNYIVEEQFEKGEALSDNDDQTVERRNEEKQGLKKVKSLKSIRDEQEESDKQDEDKNKQDEQLEKKKIKKLSFKEYEVIQLMQMNQDDEETPKRINYKGILKHLSKHKRMFLSKNTKPEALNFIKKIVQNYNLNDKSKETVDRIRLIQNQDGSYCLFKTNYGSSKNKLLKQTSDDVDSSSQSSEATSQNLAKTLMGGTTWAKSEQRQQLSDVDFTPLNEIQVEDSDVGENQENDNSVEASSSQDAPDYQKDLMDDDDSFELKKINEVDEFDDSGDEEEIFALEPIKNATSK